MDTSFDEFHLDQRLLKTLSELNWDRPTDIQAGVIPHILEKKNLIISARTGSGKTAAYMIPVIQELLVSKMSDTKQQVSVLILCPSKELCAQSSKTLTLLTKYLDLSSLNVSSQNKHGILKPMLLNSPDFIIGTPSQVLVYVKEGLINVKELKFLIIDEADLMSGFGYREDIEKLSIDINGTNCQILLLSATLGEDVKALRHVFKVRWFRLQLNNSEMLPSTDQLTQLVKKCEEEEKFNILIGMFKLNLIKGKTIIFANTVDKCYRLRIIFDTFHISSVVLNAEMPVASRNHIVHEFNIGRYDLLLASDEDNLTDNSKDSKDSKKRKLNKDEEFKISRGIDFNQVSNVINVDCPSSVESYVHRVGRAARVNQKGQAVVFVSTRDNDKFSAIDNMLMKDNNGVSVFKPFKCSRSIYEGFIYRITEALSKCTKASIRQARLLDIHKEIENSHALQAYFQENPNELKVLQHNKPVIKERNQHMKNVPSYMIPPILQEKLKKNAKKRRRTRFKEGAKPLINKKKSSNPLFSFKKKTKK